MKGRYASLLKLMMGGLILVMLVTACATPTPAPTQEPQKPAAAETKAPEAPAAAETKAPEAPAAKMKVALLLPGSIGDAGWNANAYKGLEDIKAQGYETAYTESVPVPDIEAGFRGYAEQGYKLIIGHGFEFGEPALKVAPDFPDVYFHVSGKAPPNVTIPKNVGFLDQQEFQGAYLCGVVAGLMTKSGKIGYVGGMEIPPQLANLAAYTSGARSVKPDVQILGVLTGTFEDPEKGREAALAQIANGADIIMQTADSTGMGAIQVAKEKKVYIIGYGGDQSEIAPDLVLTSLVVNNPMAIALQVKRIEEGSFGGSVWVAGIKENIIDIAKFGSMVPQDVVDKVMALRDQIVKGTFQVPEIYDRIDQK
jgi:basic membrane protein A